MYLVTNRHNIYTGTPFGHLKGPAPYYKGNILGYGADTIRVNGSEEQDLLAQVTMRTYAEVSTLLLISCLSCSDFCWVYSYLLQFWWLL